MKASAALNPEVGSPARAAPRAIAFDQLAPALLLITTIPIVISYYFVGAGLRLDESQSLWQTSRDVGGILAIIAGDVHVPLYHLLLHAWRLLFGDSIQIARVFSLVFFVASIPALYLLAKRAYSTRASLFVTFLFSISPFMNWYASEIRMYTMFVFFTILNQYFFVRILQDKEKNDTTWAFYALTSVLGVFTHYFFFLNLLSQAIFFSFRRKLFLPSSFRRFLITATLVGSAFAPWVWYVFFRGVVGFQDPMLSEPSTVDLFSTFSQFLFGFQNNEFNTVFLSLWPLAVVLGIIALGRTRQLSPPTEYFTLTLFISFAAAFLASYTIAPVFVSRYLIFTLPAFYLIVANLFSTYARSTRSFIGSSIVVLALFALSIQITNPNIAVKEQYEEAVAYLTSHTTAQDVILVSAPFSVYPVQYYYRGPAPITTLPIWNQYAYGPIPDFNSESLPSEVTLATKNYQNAYLLLSYNQEYAQTVKQYFDSHYQRIGEQNFSEGLDLYVYRLRYNSDKSAVSTTL